MRAHLRNAMFGLLDYAAYPVGMLAVAPLILHELGMVRFGVWAMANAAWNTGAVLASGFGDANIRAVADARARGASSEIVLAVRSSLAIHLAAGTCIAVSGLIAAPWIAASAARNAPATYSDCAWSLRIAAGLALLRALETVCVSTQRAFARYGAAIQISLTARLLSLAAACVVSRISAAVQDVMLWSLAISGVALWLQVRQLRKCVGLGSLTPLFRGAEIRKLARFGLFTWIQATSGLLLGQIDRLVAGVSFGAAAVTSYAMCVQLAQPTYGLCASGLHFLFPYVASLSASRKDLLRPVLRGFTANVLMAGAMLSVLLVFGNSILRAWAGARVASEAASLLAPIAWSSALAGIGVTGSYALLALNRPRTVTAFNVLGTVTTLMAIPLLIPRYGIHGLAYARLMFGPAVLLLYIPLFLITRRTSGDQREGAGLKCVEI